MTSTLTKTTKAKPKAASKLNLKHKIRGSLRMLTPTFMRRATRPLRVGSYLARNYAYDFRRYFKWSSYAGYDKSEAQLLALLTMDYHRLEKGMALAKPRVGFGQEVVQRLVQNLEIFSKDYGSHDVCQVSVNTLHEYVEFNRQNEFEIDGLAQSVDRLSNAFEQARSTEGGTLMLSRSDIHGSGKIELSGFFKSRYSIRQFSEQEVDDGLIVRAVEMAQKTPSVCNRQSSRVYVFSDADKKKRVLACQNGNRGFGEQASKVLVVVSDLENFTSVGERNQGWIDGGMYAMSLVYALHSLGLGSCCLNWSVEKHADQRLRSVAGIRDCEGVIMMIAVGHLPDSLKVAQSPRKKAMDVITFC